MFLLHIDYTKGSKHILKHEARNPLNIYRDKVARLPRRADRTDENMHEELCKDFYEEAEQESENDACSAYDYPKVR